MSVKTWSHIAIYRRTLRIAFAVLCVLAADSHRAYSQNIVPGSENETRKDYERLQKKMEKRARIQAEADKFRETHGADAELNMMNYIVEDGDTIFVDAIRPAYVFGTVKGNYKGRAWRKYRRLIYNFKKVYPYALEARKIIREADSVIAVSHFTEKQRNEYIDAYQKKLFKHFEKPLRKLSVSQGRLLLKLIDRELGRTSFYVIREYRGRLSAGFWQTVARIFGNDLKKPYDRFGEDRATEDLVELYQNGAFDALYYSMFWK